MIRRPALLFVLVLSACAKSQAPQPASGGNATQIAPVSPQESQAIKNKIRFGHGLGPDEVLQPAVADGASCAGFVSQLPGNFQSGFLNVPEDWDHPDTSPKIQVFYYWRQAQGAAAGRAPVVFFNGGPAEDSHGSAQLLAPLDFTADASLVFLDQRGTGCSTPFPGDLTVRNADRLANWGSRGIVGDAEALRKQLFGDRRWRVYGQSYGGLLVHRYMELAPEGVDRAIAHGFSVMQDPVSWQADRVSSQQRVGATYFAKYPGDKEALLAARAAIPADQCWKNGSDTMCGPNVLDSFTILLGFQDSWASLHEWISRLDAGSGKVSQKVLSGVVRNYVFGVYGAGGLGGDVISKMEIVPGYDDRSGCTAAMERLRTAGQDPDSFPINECRLLVAYQKPNFDLMKDVAPRPVLLDRVAANITKDGFAFYLFSGQQDVFVPYATFNEEVTHLGKLVHYESFPSSGHEGFYTEPDVTRAVSSLPAP